MARRSGRRSAPLWWLVALVALGAVATLHYQRVGSEVTGPHEASSFNALPDGVKAYYLLAERERLPVARLESAWPSLNGQTGTLVVVEPLHRAPLATELVALRRWITQGGRLIYFVAPPPRPIDPADPVAGDIAVVAAPAARSYATPSGPAVSGAGIGSVAVSARVRLRPEPGAYQPLLRDHAGIVAARKGLGRGEVIVVADPYCVSNDGIGQADDALFAMFLLGQPGEGKSVAFDEYHHGIGAQMEAGDNDGLWSALPAPLRLAVFHVLIVAILWLYCANRLLGLPRALPQEPAAERPGYIEAMARFLRRAGASDLALSTLYHGLLRDALGADASVEPGVAAPALAARTGLDQASVTALLERCADVSAGERIAAQELTDLAMQIRELRRRCGLVGPAGAI